MLVSDLYLLISARWVWLGLKLVKIKIITITAAVANFLKLKELILKFILYFFFSKKINVTKENIKK